MPGVDTPASAATVFDLDGLAALVTALKSKGYRVIGPRVADDAVVYDDIDDVRDLPAGIGDEQAGGRYRLRKRGDSAVFGYTVSPQGWKRHLFPPRQKLFAARRSATGFEVLPPDPAPPPFAFIGVRACELAAMAVQAKVFGDKDYADPGYQGRLKDAFVVAVECGEAGDLCFCASMGTGPAVKAGYDVKLVELAGKDGPRFIATAGTARGEKMLGKLKAAKAADGDLKAAADRVAKAAKKMGRKMETATSARLKEFSEHPRWDQVAARCMTCGNCTMVCPTCFCTTVEDVTDLKGDNAERWRMWDSCFSVEFSYIHGGPIRSEARSRYRQWITHKLSTWFDQFGTAGCVGCGRCIAWCPVGIDITEEVAAIHESLKGRK
ncbi:4Fe-4S dicluster domain-containing protein [Magnetospirillum sp. UT-4]|uniref:4Fe-4S dicluster domain-containing protein n=1 Tax=Magnetospirillum sp. UT-4 TaxID=2681467 RepID=UPI00137E07EA|nr:4Fe-4S dicluster domain-containing protein [Magnetospirillum sp. UT-4]CAA7613555.1 4Fe-4S ferredoxin, iron-sulfur binding [Magnetospirillum sp. UT-4]